MTVLRLAASAGPIIATAKGIAGAHPEYGPAPLLVSYYYLKVWEEIRAKFSVVYRDWVMDSGAYSADNKGAKIDLQLYIDTCLRLSETDPTLTEIFALDVISDPVGSLRNTEEMWRQGVRAIPAFHIGEPWEVLTEIARVYPKIAVGGMVGLANAQKMKWLEQVMARVWPKRVHLFGCVAEPILMAMPFHSADASSWNLTPTAFGTWAAWGRASWRGGKQDLRSEVEHYQAIGARVAWRWRKEMAKLEELSWERT